MTQQEWITVAVGTGLIAVAGVFHLMGLRCIRWLKPPHDNNPHWGVLVTFWCLLLLHLVEIAGAAAMLAWMDTWEGYGAMGTDTVETAGDYLYVAGISYTTLGYTELEADGPIRMLTMFLALGGFMLITWSATFIFTIWGEGFRSHED